MAIQIQLTEIKNLTTRSIDVTSRLNNELTSVVSLLEEICNNVQSSELMAANNNLKNAITNASNTINTNMPEINNFLIDQVEHYTGTNESAKSQIDSLVSSINSTFQS